MLENSVIILAMRIEPHACLLLVQELRQQLAMKMGLVQQLIEQQGEKYTDIPDDLTQMMNELQQVRNEE